MRFPIRKILYPGFAPEALAFGLRRLEALGVLWGNSGPHAQSYQVFDNLVRIKHQPPFQYIYVQPTGGTIYEFATGAFDEVTQDFVVASGAQMSSKGKATALFSMSFASPVAPATPRWRDVSPSYTFLRDGTETHFFKTFLSYQPQAVHEAVWWPNNSMSAVVHSTWGMPNGRMNTAGQCDALHSDGGTKSHCAEYTGLTSLFPRFTNLYSYDMEWYSGLPFGNVTDVRVLSGVDTVAVAQYDRLFDIPPTYYSTGGVKLGGIGPYRDDYTWYRHGVLIKSNLGNPFFVVADSKGGFMAYRAKAYWADAGVLAACVDQPGFPGTKSPASTAVPYKRVVPDYPAWVTLPTDGVETPLQWWNWQFNKDGSKAVTVAMNSTDRAKWFHHADADDPTKLQNPAWWDGWFVDPINSDMTSTLLFDEAKKGTACRKDIPGLVEVSIAITETGSGDLDFSVNIEVTQEDYFGDSGRYWVDAAYAFPGVSVAEDSLVTAEIECYRTTEHWFKKVDSGTGAITDGAVDGSDYVPGSEQIDIAGLGAAWVVKSGATELAREVLQDPLPISSFLPYFDRAYYPTPPKPPFLSYARSLGPKLDRLGTVTDHMPAVLIKVTKAKGMFTIGNTALWDSRPLTRQLAEIVASDLRSLSYCVRQEQFSWPSGSDTPSGTPTSWYAHETIQHKLVAFGSEQTLPGDAGKTRRSRYTSFTGWFDGSNETAFDYDPVGGTETITYEPFTMNAAPSTVYQMDKTLHEQVYTCMALSRLPNYTHHEIRTTPYGDWSVWVVDGDVGFIDMVHSVAGGRTLDTTHLALFNTAFGKSLAVGYYGTVSATSGYRNTGGFGLARNWLPRAQK